MGTEQNSVGSITLQYGNYIADSLRFTRIIGHGAMLVLDLGPMTSQLAHQPIAASLMRLGARHTRTKCQLLSDIRIGRVC